MEHLHVLIIEDDAMIGALLGEMLKELGNDVCATVATEEDAVAAAARCKPTLMIVDEQLAEGSGISAVNRILCNGSVPFILMSGAPVRRAGVVVLQKPFSAADLVLALRLVAGAAASPALLPIGKYGD